MVDSRLAAQAESPRGGPCDAARCCWSGAESEPATDFGFFEKESLRKSPPAPPLFGSGAAPSASAAAAPALFFLPKLSMRVIPPPPPPAALAPVLSRLEKTIPQSPGLDLRCAPRPQRETATVDAQDGEVRRDPPRCRRDRAEGALLGEAVHRSLHVHAHVHVLLIRKQVRLRYVSDGAGAHVRKGSAAGVCFSPPPMPAR